MRALKFIAIVIFFVSVASLCGYGAPRLGLGFNNILDGGPLRSRAGWYVQQFYPYFHGERFVGPCGKNLFDVPSPKINAFAAVTEFVYQSGKEVFFSGRPGMRFALPLVLANKVSANDLDIKSSGAGFGNLLIGAFLQFSPTMYNERALFVHRLDFNITLPIGKNRQPCFSINPAPNFFYIDPYWAATLFLAKDWAISWRINYLWNDVDEVNNVQGGQAIHLNYSFEHEFRKDLWLSVCGYYLKSITDNKLNGVSVPNSREQVFAVGPGAVYTATPHLKLLAYLYFESKVRNRVQGTVFIFRFLLHF